MFLTLMAMGPVVLLDKLKWMVVTLLILSLNDAAAKKKSIDSKEFVLNEIASVDKQHACHLKSKNKSPIYNLWYSDKVSRKTHVCLLKYLENNIKDGVAWCMLGSLYIENERVNEANSCFQIASELLVQNNLIKIDAWHFLGPFSIGKSEFDGDPSLSHGGIHNISRFRFNAKTTKYYSELLPRGEISWKSLPMPKANDFIQVRPEVDWNDLVSSLGSMGVTEWQGWAVGQFVTTQWEQTLSVQCLGVARCLIDSTTVAGDFYRRGDYWTSIKLTRGVHQIFVPLRAKVAASFKVSIAKKGNFIIMLPSFLPQIYDGYLPKEIFISIPISNQMSGKWLGVSRVSVQDSSNEINWKASLLNKNYRIAPGQILHVIIQISSPEMEEGQQVTSSCSDVHLQIKIKTSEGVENLDATLTCRKRGSSFLFTFIDHDGSVQHGATIEPLGSCLDGHCPVVLSLHGTTVPPQNQADSYKKMVKGDFEFGVAKMWLLAPSRHGAHNWEGPGALTAMFAVQALGALVESCNWFTVKVDPSKILFAGHSMGGHGALHLATHFPDKAIGLMSLAGWISKEGYGDSNLFFRHDVATSHVDPMTKSMMETCVAENDVDKHVSNLKDVPVLLRIGARDRTVHPYFLRRMYRLMKENGVNVEYSELPNLEHWWWDTLDTNDGGCMNDAKIQNFMSSVYTSLPFKKQTSSCSKDGNEGCGDKTGTDNRYSQSRQDSEHRATFVTYNPAFSGSMKGVSVLQQIVPLQKSTIEMGTHEGRLVLVTKNVQCLALADKVQDAAILWVERQNGYLPMEMDGSEIDVPFEDFPIIVCRNGTSWSKVQAVPSLSRSHRDYGPARRVSEKPFLIIAGTQGNDSVSSQILAHSTYIANQFMLTSDSLAPVIKDTDVQDHVLDEKNLIIIGNPDENLLTAKYLEKLTDLTVETTHVTVGTFCQYKWSQVGILTLSPHGQDGLALLLMGGSANGLTDVINLATPTIPPMARSPFSNLLPDYVIAGPRTGLQGPGGFECTGFWDNSWRYSMAASSCVCR